MTNNILDFDTAKRRKPPKPDEPAHNPFDDPPFMTISFYEGDGQPVRIAGSFETGPQAIRQAALRLERVIIELLNRAYHADPDPQFLLRFTQKLFHDGSFAMVAYNGSGPEGAPSRADIGWIIKSFPHVGVELMRQYGINPEDWPL